MAAGFPRLLNFNPLTDAFAVSMENATHAKVGIYSLLLCYNFFFFMLALSIFHASCFVKH